MVKKSKPIEERDWYDYQADAILNNKLLINCVTSAAEGMLPNEGFKFGQGKSQFSIWNSHNQYEMHNTLVDPWESSLTYLGYTWEHLEKIVDISETSRITSYVQDDVQLIAGKSRARDRRVQEWAEWLSTARPFFGVITFTCPSIDTLAKTWRELIDFEIKIPERGKFEVHQLKTKTIYKKPLEPYKRLNYFEDGIFPELPEPIAKRYNIWRKESSIASAPHRRKRETPKPPKRAPVDIVHKRLMELGYDVPRTVLRQVEEMAAALPV